jgi:hypothetical protein
MNKFEGFQALKVLKTIHWSITLVPLLLAAIVFYMNSGSVISEMNDIYLYAALLILAIAVPLSSFTFKTYLRKMNLSSTSPAKEIIPAYQTAHLLRLVIIEIAGFFGIIGSYVSGSNLILGVTAVAIMFMASLTPSYMGIAETFDFVNE